MGDIYHVTSCGLLNWTNHQPGALMHKFLLNAYGNMQYGKGKEEHESADFHLTLRSLGVSTDSRRML